MNFLKKHRICSRFIGITLSIAILIACVPLLGNNTTVAAEEVGLPNLVAGGDFESGTTLPTQFETVVGYESEFSDYYTIQSTDQPTGFTGNNLKITWNKNDFSTFTFFTVKVPVEIGTTYTLNYKIYTPDTTGKVGYRFSYGTAKWNGSNWVGYGSGRDDTSVKAKNGTVTQTITATSNQLWLLFGVKDARDTVNGDATVYFDDITVTPVVEYVADGSFETGNLNKWNKNDPNSKLSVVKASDENITKYDNEYVLKITGAANWPYVGREGSNAVAVTSGSTYQFSFYVYRVSANSEAVFKVGNSSSATAYNYNGNQQYLNSGGIGSSATGTWIKVTRTFTATDSVVCLYFTSNGATKDTVYIDKVSIKKKLTVSATAQEGGSVSGLPTGDVYSGDKIGLKATPDEGYEFDGWYNGEEKISSDAAYSYIAYNDKALTAKFKAKDFELIKNGSFEDGFADWQTHSDYSVIEGGTSGAPAAYEGSNIAKVAGTGDWHPLKQGVTLEKNSDYLFSFWYYKTDDNNILALKVGNSTSDEAYIPVKWLNNWLASNKWVNVKFKFNSGNDTVCNLFMLSQGTGIAYFDDVSIKKIVKVTATAENGTVSGVPETVVQGDQLTVTAVPDAGFAFSGWYKNGVRVSDTASYTFYAAEDAVLQAKFESTNNLIVGGGFEGTELNAKWINSYNRGSITNTEKYDGAQSLFIEKQGGYANLYYWPLDVEKNTNYRITMKVKIPADADIPIIKVLDGAGSGNSLLDQAVSDGNTWLNARNNKIAAGCDWQEAYFTFNSGECTRVSLLFTGNANASAYIDDINVIKYYNITATAQGAGKVTGFSQGWAYTDAPVSLTAEANPGSGFDGWYENDVKISSDLVLQFNAAADRVIVAKFEELDNYILDSGFELESLHNNWINSWDRLSVTDEEAYEGEQSLHISKTELTIYPYGHYPITVKPNTNYMIKMMVKIPTGSGAPLLQALGASNTHLLNERDMSNNNFFINGGTNDNIGGGWFPVTATFNSGNNTSVKIAFTGNTKAEAYVDNLIVGEAYTATITAGENGSVSKTTVLGLKNAVTTITAIPDKDYMVEGWYINGEKVSEEKNYNHLFTSDVALEVKFTVSDLPIMTDFDLEKLWCAESNNILSDSSFEIGTGEWNTASFIKSDVLDVVELDGQKVLYFNPDGIGRQVMYFPVALEGNTEYMFSAKVRGKYYSDTNHMDMSFGIMNDDGEYIMLESVASGGYYDESPNVTTTKSITPPSWDNNWHRRGITFKTVAPTTVWVAVSGNLSEAYLDDFMLCKLNKAVAMPVEENIATRTSINISEDKMGCADNDNLVENYNFNGGETGWEDGYGWHGLYSGVYVAETGEENKSLLMRSTTGYADYHYYIQWIDVKPNTEYTFSLASAATSLESDYGLFVEGAKRYNKLISWTAESDSEWVYNALSFNSNDSTRVGIFVMDGGRATALDDIRLFETSKATALANKLTGKADIPEELIISPEDEEDIDSDEGEEILLENEENLDDEDKEDEEASENEDETPKTKTKKKVVKVIKNNADSDYTLWWILGGVGVALLLAGTILLIIILIKKKRKR